MLLVGAAAGGVSHATLPPCSNVLVCPCLACPPLHLPPTVSFLRANSSEPKQQFHLFCQGWECTQPSLAVFCQPHWMPNLWTLLICQLFPFFRFLSLCLLELMTVPMSKSVVKVPEKGSSVWLFDSELITLCAP